VGEKYVPLKLKVKLACVTCYFAEQLFCERLSAELTYQAFVIDFALDFPGRDNHFVFSIIRRNRVDHQLFLTRRKAPVIYPFFARLMLVFRGYFSFHLVTSEPTIMKTTASTATIRE
jgi:hypothetical protein